MKIIEYGMIFDADKFLFHQNKFLNYNETFYPFPYFYYFFFR